MVAIADSGERTKIVLEREFDIIYLKVPHRGVEVTASTVARAIQAACRVANVPAWREEEDDNGNMTEVPVEAALLLARLLRDER